MDNIKKVVINTAIKGRSPLSTLFLPAMISAAIEITGLEVEQIRSSINGAPECTSYIVRTGCNGDVEKLIKIATLAGLPGLLLFTNGSAGALLHLEKDAGRLEKFERIKRSKNLPAGSWIILEGERFVMIDAEGYTI